MNFSTDEPEESNICCNLRSSLQHIESEPSSSHHYLVAMLMDEFSSVCVGNWRTDCSIFSHRKKENGGSENPQNVKMKRRYLRKSCTSINTNNKYNKCNSNSNSNSNFNKRPRISLRPSFGILMFFLIVVGLPSIVQAQNSTIAPSQSILEEPVTSIAETDNNVTTVSPSTTMKPSGIPSIRPTQYPTVSMPPSVSPTTSPTDQATLEDPSVKENKFRQSFTVGNGRMFSDFEVTVFQTIYAGHTFQFAPTGEADKVDTNCTIFNQQFQAAEESEDGGGESGERRRSRRLQLQLRSNTNRNTSLLLEQDNGNFVNSNGSLPQKLRGKWHRYLQAAAAAEEATSAPAPVPSDVVIDVDFTMKYDSKYYNVSDYPRMFQNWTNLNLDTIQKQMNVLNLNVTNVSKASRIVVSTPAPSMSPFPSATPTGKPTITASPSTLIPSLESMIPTSLAKDAGLESDNSDGSGTEKKKNNNKVIIVVSVIIALSIVAIGVLIYCKKRRQTREIELQADAVNKSSRHEGHRSSDEHTEGGWGGGAAAAAATKARYDNAGGGKSSGETKAYGSAFSKHLDGPSGLDGVVVSPNGSLVSNQSLLSRGNSMGGHSKDEADTTQIFADEFDQYKDQNLEKMRADVEGNLEGCDGMMSQAVARALIEEDDITTVSDVLWGGKDNVTGPEIEASALGIIMDWLKRNDKATAREK